MRTLYGSNLSKKSSPDVEIAVDEPVMEEAPFTTVTNKKCKDKGKVPFSTNPSLPFQNTPTSSTVVLRVSPLPPPAKTAVTKPTYVKVTTIPQVPKQVPKSFAQVIHSRNTYPTPRFVPASAHSEYESLLYLHDMFPDLSMEKALAIYQSSFGASISPNRGGATHPGASRAPKIITHGCTRCQVLIPLNAPTAEIIVANTTMVVESCNRGLIEAHSKLRVKSVYKA